MKIDKVLVPKYVVPIGLFVIIAAYALFQARFIILGPRVSITNPKDGSTLTHSLVMIEGKASNVSRITLNDRQIFTDENGLWEEELLLSPGLSIMTLKATDRFGREITKSIQLVLKQ